MKFIAIAAIFATSGLASVCPTGLFSNALCCATSVLGVIGLDCNTVPIVPTSGPNFKDICAQSGNIALCCVAPVAQQGVLCQDAPFTES